MADELPVAAREQGLPENFTLAFSDSEVSGVDARDDTLVVAFSAAYVQSSMAGAGYMQGLEMIFTQAQWAGALGECVGRLRYGRLCVDGELLSQLALPCHAAGAITAELEFNNDAVLSVTASAVDMRFGSVPRFLESFAC